jgi:hypothetical protein
MMLFNVLKEQVDLQCIIGLSCVTAPKMSSVQTVSVSKPSANDACIASQDVMPSYFNPKAFRPVRSMKYPITQRRVL